MNAPFNPLQAFPVPGRNPPSLCFCLSQNFPPLIGDTYKMVCHLIIHTFLIVGAHFAISYSYWNITAACFSLPDVPYLLFGEAS